LVGDFAHVNLLDEMYQKLKRRPRNDKSIQSPSQEAEDDETEHEDDNATDRMDVEEMDIDSLPKQGPVIDEEGFELVQKGRRKGR